MRVGLARSFVLLTECHSISNIFLFRFFFIFSTQNGFTPLHIAAKYNSANAAVLLTNSGADIDALTKVTYTLLFSLLLLGFIEQFKN